MVPRRSGPPRRPHRSFASALDRLRPTASRSPSRTSERHGLSTSFDACSGKGKILVEGCGGLASDICEHLVFSCRTGMVSLATVPTCPTPWIGSSARSWSTGPTANCSRSSRGAGPALIGAAESLVPRATMPRGRGGRRRPVAQRDARRLSRIAQKLDRTRTPIVRGRPTDQVRPPVPK